MFFQDRSLGPFFKFPGPNFYKKLVWGAILDFHDFQKGTLWTTFSHKMYTFAVTFFLVWASLSRPCISRDHNNYCAFGTKSFVRWWLAHFLFFCFSLCYVLYTIFITFVHKTSVSAQPLNPLIFEKIYPHFKNNVFSYVGSVRLRFILLFHMFVDFRVDGRCWSHFCLVLVEVVERRRRIRQNDAYWRL